MIRDKRICIVGLGGLGGFVCEFIARENIKEIVLIDGDKFSKSNINRQLECNEKTIGKYKVDIYKDRIKNISDSKVITYKKFLNENNLNYLDNCDLVFDCLDNIESRLLLEKACSKKKIPIIHGAIGSNFGNVCLCLPGSKLIEKLYKDKNIIKLETKANSVAFVSSIQVEVALKYFENKFNDIKNKLIFIDLEELQIKMLSI